MSYSHRGWSVELHCESEYLFREKLFTIHKCYKESSPLHLHLTRVLNFNVDVCSIKCHVVTFMETANCDTGCNFWVGLERQSRDLRMVSEMSHTFTAFRFSYGVFKEVMTASFLLFTSVYKSVVIYYIYIYIYTTVQDNCCVQQCYMFRSTTILRHICT